MASFKSISCLLVVAISSLVSGQSGQVPCYYPDGTMSSHTPCNYTSPDAVSPCCAPNTMCLSNGYCISGGQVFSGSCTSKRFETPCAQGCNNANNRGMPISPCSQSTFICGFTGSYENQCKDSSKIFTIDTADTGVLLRPWQAPSLVSTTIGPYTVLSVSNSSSSDSTIVSSNDTMSDQATTTSGEMSCPAQSAGYSAGVVAGVAVGIGGPLLLALAGAVFVILRQKKQLRRLRSAEVQGTHHSDKASGQHILQPGNISSKHDPIEAYTPPPEADSSLVCEVEGTAPSNGFDGRGRL